MGSLNGLSGLSGLSGLVSPSSYINKILGIESANLIAYWPLNETSGAIADNAEGTAARDGAYTGVTLNDTTGPAGGPAGRWDGANDYCNIYSASLNSAFDGTTGTLALWIRPFNAGVWTDGVSRYITTLWSSGSNNVFIRKSTAANTIIFQYEANNVVESVSLAISSTGWTHLALTWDSGADEVKAYENGVQTGLTQTGLGAFSGNLSATLTNIGSLSQPGNVWNGYITHVAMWTVALSDAQILDLATV